jgi:hypothetical protein
MSKSPTWSEILLSSLSMIFTGCLLSHFDRSWSFIMEAILWRVWRHVITWPLSSLKCIGQRSGRFQKVIINKSARPRGLLDNVYSLFNDQIKQNWENYFCVISPLTPLKKIRNFPHFWNAFLRMHIFNKDLLKHKLIFVNFNNLYPKAKCIVSRCSRVTSYLLFSSVFNLYQEISRIVMKETNWSYQPSSINQ